MSPRLRALVAPLLLFAAGCFSEKVPASIMISCQSSADCPAGYECRTALQRCVPSDSNDQTAPSLAGTPAITPAVARAGVTLSVKFQVSKALSSDPTVHVGDRELAVDESGTSRSTLSYTYSYKVTGGEPEASAVPVTIDLVDVSGNAATGLAGGSARFDFTPPSLVANPTIAPALVGKAVASSVTLAFSEPLSADPVVSMSSPSGQSADLSWKRTGSGTSYSYQFVPDGSEEQGDWQVTVVATDVAGNASRAIALGTLTLDFTPPTVVGTATVTPAAASAGRTITVEILASEPVQSGATLTGKTAGGKSLSFTAGTVSNRVLTFEHTAASGEDGAYALTLSGLKDTAGNVAGDLAVGTATVDTQAPQVQAIATDAQSYSAQSGHDQVRLTFNVDEPVDVGSLLVTLGGAPMTCQPYQSASPNYTCTFAVTGKSGDDGARRIVIGAIDAAGNVGEGNAEVEFDFTGPSVVAGSMTVQLIPGAANPLANLTAVTTGTSVRATFVMSEAVSSDPAVATTTPEALAFAKQSSAGNLYVYQMTLSAGAHAEGKYALAVTATDAVGNQGTTTLPGQFTVDLTPPAKADVITAGKVTYQRVPWGSSATGGQTEFRVDGAAGAAEAGATVRALDSADVVGAAELGRATAAADGSFHATLGHSDHSVVYISAVDGAGNQSAAVDVKDVVWTATLNGKVAGSTFANPHSYETRAWFTRRYTQGDAVPLADVTPITSADAKSQATRGGGDWSLRASTAIPNKFANGAMVFDSARGRGVLFGGGVNNGNGTTWEWDGGSWLQRTPTDPEGDGNPNLRLYHAMAYDSGRGRTVLFGGCGDAECLSGALGDTWEWDGASWALRAPADATGKAAPLPRAFHAMTYDSARGKVLLFGGGFVGTYPVPELNDTWEWDGATWTQVSAGDPAGVTTPSPRSSPAMAFDPVRGRAVLHGGGKMFLLVNGCVSGSGCDLGLQSDTWEWDGTKWTLRTLSDPEGDGNPTPRMGHGAVWDAGRQRILLFGGLVGTNSLAPSALGDTWAYDGSVPTWKLLWADDPTGNTRPIARFSYAMIYDTVRGVTILTNGMYPLPTSTVWPHDLWALDATAWALRTVGADSPAPRATHQMAWDSLHHHVVLFGGSTDSSDNGPDADVWDWDGNVWSLQMAADPAGVTTPLPRVAPVMAYDQSRQRCVVYGGCTDVYCVQPKLDDTWEWDGTAWTLIGSGSPSARGFGTMAYDATAKDLVAVDGNQGNLIIVSLPSGTYKRSGTTWSQATAGAHDPAGLWRVNSATSANGVLLFGGWDSNRNCDGVTREWKGSAWTVVAPADPAGISAPAGRVSQAMTWDGQRQRVMLHGGQDQGGNPFGDLWEWDGAKWTSVASADPEGDGSPTPRMAHALAYDMDRGQLVLFGGADLTGAMGDTWEWNNGPAAQPGHVARFVFGAADAEPNATINSVTANWVAGGDGLTAGASTPGALAWFWDKGSFLPGPSIAAPSASPAALTWTTSDPSQLSRIFNGPSREIAVAVTPLGTNGSGAATLAVDYLELLVRYRRP